MEALNELDGFGCSRHRNTRVLFLGRWACGFGVRAAFWLTVLS